MYFLLSLTGSPNTQDWQLSPVDYTLNVNFSCADLPVDETARLFILNTNFTYSNLAPIFFLQNSYCVLATNTQ